MPHHIKNRLHRQFPWINRQRLNLILKSIVFLGFIGVLYFDLLHQAQAAQLAQHFLETLRHANSGWLIAAILLMPLNWLAELKKWYQFVRQYDPISFRNAYLAIFAGISFSLFTPNRVGEYGGRIVFIQPRNRWKAVIANLVGNLAQFIVLLSAGMIGAQYTLQRIFPIDPPFRLAFALTGTLGIGLLFLLYFHIDLIIPLGRRIPGIRHIKRFVKDLAVLRHFSRPELTQIALWALLRYGIYSLQYACILYFFGLKSGLTDTLAGISTLFLLQTALPLPPVSGLVARGSLAIHVWTAFGLAPLSSLAATFALFIINLILPSFIGFVALLRLNLAQSIGYEDDETNGVRP